MENRALTPSFAELRAMPRDQLATALLDLKPTDLRELFAQVGDEALASLIAELEPVDAVRLIRKLDRAAAADLLEEMDPDDAADIAGKLESDEAEAIFIEMDPVDVEELRQLLNYPPDSAGGIMTTDYVAIAPDLTADEALAALRAIADQAETVYYIYVTNPVTNELLGVLSLRNLVLARSGARIRDLMVTDVVKVEVTADREVAARVLEQHGLLALPVVDAGNRLVGIITADDASLVLLAEAQEDLERLGGAQPLEEPYLRASVFRLFRKRVGWLLILFAAEAYTGTVLRHFEETLSEVVALAFFIPLLIGTGGNVGSQTVTTLVRAMVIGEVRLRNIFRVLRKEVAVGALLGVVMGLAAFIRALTLGVGPELGQVVALTALCIVLWAITVAAVLPLILKQLRIDPAVVSAPFIATLVDGTGLIIYFEIARWLLQLR